jgi:hypothetical protein
MGSKCTAHKDNLQTLPCRPPRPANAGGGMDIAAALRLSFSNMENTMATSTLDPDNVPEPDRRLGTGHDTSSLGPSDLSDTGSDVQGGLRWAGEADIGLDKGTNEDPDSGPRDATAGPDLGDTGLDSDTDSSGTGERATSGRDTDIEAGRDIDVDRIEYLSPEDDPDFIDRPDVARDRPRPQHPGGAPHRR